MPTTETDRVLSAYIECALWSSVHIASDDDNGTPMDTLDADLADETRASMLADATSAIEAADAIDLEWRDFWTAEQFGHDLWLTRNGHGAGFWDRYYGDHDGAHIGRKLTDMAHSMGGIDLYLGDDGKIYG